MYIIHSISNHVLTYTINNVLKTNMYLLFSDSIFLHIFIIGFLDDRYY